jgi:hypothetical protein
MADGEIIRNGILFSKTGVNDGQPHWNNFILI